MQPITKLTFSLFVIKSIPNVFSSFSISLNEIQQLLKIPPTHPEFHGIYTICKWGNLINQMVNLYHQVYFSLKVLNF